MGKRIIVGPTAMFVERNGVRSAQIELTEKDTAAEVREKAKALYETIRKIVPFRLWARHRVVMAAQRDHAGERPALCRRVISSSQSHPCHPPPRRHPAIRRSLHPKPKRGSIMFSTLLPVILPVIMGQLRHFLTIAGASLTTSGLLSGADVQTGIGAVVTVATLVLSAISKVRAAKAA